MRFENVSIASLGYVIPPESLTSTDIERHLAPLYQRLKLPEGRLELMTGIRQRRLFPAGSRLSDWSALACQRALEASDFDARHVGCLIHASVCREFLEPATACRVHHLLGLPMQCWTYDLSNACLGLLNGMQQVASLIESGVITAGLVVGTEDSRGLTEATLRDLNENQNYTRQSIKNAFASLTIGSGSCAALLVNSERFGSAGKLHGCVARSHTAHHELCKSDTDQAGATMQPTMNTDSEQLLKSGIETGAQTFNDFLTELKWQRDEIEQTVCHQVGIAHRRQMLERLGLPEEKDFASFPDLGNTGSVALPSALAIGLHSGQIKQPCRTALLGIGSGINSIMIGVDAHNIQLSGNYEALAES